MNAYKKLLLVSLIVLLNGLAASAQQIHRPLAQNYSSDVLRLAKAAQIKAYLNEEIDPCDNFYKFACGKWRRLQPAGTNLPNTSYLEQLQSLYVEKSAEMLKGGDRKIDDTGVVDSMLKDFYESCLNKGTADQQQLGMDHVLKVVDFKGGWPKVTSNSWYEYEYDWLKVIAELRRKLGVDILVGLDVIPDFEDKDMHRIKVGAPSGLNLASKFMYQSEDAKMQREDYRTQIVNKLNLYFHDVMPADWAKEVADQVLYMETQLAKGLPDNAELTLKQITRQRYAAELKAAYGSYVDLSRYLNIIFNETIYLQVYETPEDYMENLVEVIKQTPKLTIANYTMWRVLEMFDFSVEINKHQINNWCIHKVMEYFPHQLENMFHRNYNNMQIINELQSVWADIKKTFREELKASTKLNWITWDTRQKAILKLDAMQFEIINHASEHLEDHMHGLVLHEKEYRQNLINIMQWQTQQNLAKLIEKPKIARTTPVRLPKYQLLTNKIQIPITFLQPRFFWDATYPNALKYSTLGFMLAQEMTHGFDSIGRKYDNHGYQRSWWDIVSEYAFDERAKCFANQYASATNYSGKNVSNPDALTINIANNGGLAIAYRAYQKWLQNAAVSELNSNKETLLPLLNYTQNQLFFIGFAQVWCADYTDKTATDHNDLPEALRVSGSLANFQEFANDFKCQIGDNMNPANKCVIY